MTLSKYATILHKIEKAFLIVIFFLFFKCKIRRCSEICNKIRELVVRAKREAVPIEKLQKNTRFLKVQLKKNWKFLKYGKYVMTGEF